MDPETYIAHTVIDKYIQITQNSTTIINILFPNLPLPLLYLETEVRIKLQVIIPNCLQLSKLELSLRDTNPPLSGLKFMQV